MTVYTRTYLLLRFQILCHLSPPTRFQYYFPKCRENFQFRWILLQNYQNRVFFWIFSVYIRVKIVSCRIEIQIYLIYDIVSCRMEIQIYLIYNILENIKIKIGFGVMIYIGSELIDTKYPWFHLAQRLIFYSDFSYLGKITSTAFYGILFVFCKEMIIQLSCFYLQIYLIIFNFFKTTTWLSQFYEKQFIYMEYRDQIGPSRQENFQP